MRIPPSRPRAQAVTAASSATTSARTSSLRVTPLLAARSASGHNPPSRCRSRSWPSTRASSKTRTPRSSGTASAPAAPARMDAERQDGLRRHGRERPAARGYGMVRGSYPARRPGVRVRDQLLGSRHAQGLTPTGMDRERDVDEDPGRHGTVLGAARARRRSPMESLSPCPNCGSRALYRSEEVEATSTHGPNILPWLGRFLYRARMSLVL